MAISKLQIDTIVNVIYQKIEEKISSLISNPTAEVIGIVENIKTEISYEEKFQKSLEIKQLVDRLDVLKKEYRDTFKVSYTHYDNLEEGFETLLKSIVRVKLKEKFPKFNEIKTEVILSGNNPELGQIVEALSTKYNLNQNNE